MYHFLVPINLSILDFKSNNAVAVSNEVSAINLSILDFKLYPSMLNGLRKESINLSILDFKYLTAYVWSKNIPL